ncbi:MAG TPA: 3-phosphoshikimate 1-carboxyvinyltransferase [Fimbriimonadaceae bacterium]|nr:3-phosphoshikimate 1-carboxyvinyltransferase [Fimbriimonadaceae bacterium]
MVLRIEPVRNLRGTFRPPSDKSLTHRAYMFGAIASSESAVRKPLEGEDCESTLRCLRQLGLEVERAGSEIRLRPAPEWTQPADVLDCGNSGTTMRLLSGLLASRPLDTTLVGDASLSKRPMKRIAEPLRRMGARVEGDTPPLHIVGGPVEAITYESPVASAQVKSAILLAGLQARGRTVVMEPHLSRDHTERMLSALGVPISQSSNSHFFAAVEGPAQPIGFEFLVPGDISGAAFFLVATALLPGSEVDFHELGINPSRTGILDVLTMTGAEPRLIREWNELGEPVADISMESCRHLKSFEISGGLVPRLIDEIPVLAVLATQCDGTTLIRDAGELRVKECDRLEAMSSGLRAMGAQIETFDDGMAITGPTPLKATRIDAQLDHRIAMSFAIAGLIAEGTTEIEGAEAIATSFPQFESELKRLAGNG